MLSPVGQILVEIKAEIERKVIADGQDKGTKKVSPFMSNYRFRRDSYSLI